MMTLISDARMGGCTESIRFSSKREFNRGVIGLLTCCHAVTGGHNFMVDSDRMTVYCSETGLKCALDAVEQTL